MDCKKRSIVFEKDVRHSCDFVLLYMTTLERGYVS